MFKKILHKADNSHLNCLDEEHNFSRRTPRKNVLRLFRLLPAKLFKSKRKFKNFNKDRQPNVGNIWNKAQIDRISEF